MTIASFGTLEAQTPCPRLLPHHRRLTTIFSAMLFPIPGIFASASSSRRLTRLPPKVSSDCAALGVRANFEPIFASEFKQRGNFLQDGSDFTFGHHSIISADSFDLDAAVVVFDVRTNAAKAMDAIGTAPKAR
jgi:hypothetical protein